MGISNDEMVAVVAELGVLGPLLGIIAFGLGCY